MTVWLKLKVQVDKFMGLCIFSQNRLEGLQGHYHARSTKRQMKQIFGLCKICEEGRYWYFRGVNQMVFGLLCTLGLHKLSFENNW